MTSAPMSPRSIEQNGPATTQMRSTTLKPVSSRSRKPNYDHASTPPRGDRNAHAVLCARRLLHGAPYRAGGGRREVREEAHGPLEGRAEDARVHEDPPARPRAGAQARRRQPAYREHRDPAVSRQALRPVADRSGQGGEGALRSEERRVGK